MDKQLALVEHFVELRKVVLRVALFFLCAFVVSYVYAEEIFGILLKPFVSSMSTLDHREIIYTSLTEAFVVYIQLAFFTALLVTLPCLCFQIFAFVMPALSNKEKKFACVLLCMVPLLFVAGVLTAYLYAFPAAWKFFLSFEKPNYAHLGLPLKFYVKLEEYLALAVEVMLAFGFAFQIPAVLVFLNRVGVLPIKTLRAQRKLVIVLIFIVAAVITPPDALSQIILASVMIMLYELSIFLCILLKDRELTGA